MMLGAQFLRPFGLAHAGALLVEPTGVGWLILIAAYSGVAYALGRVIRALFRRH